jgi:hypothetical protein
MSLIFQESHACKKEIWLKGLLSHHNSEHIMDKYDFVSHVIAGGGVIIKKVHCVDMLIKPTLLEMLQWCLDFLDLSKRE